MGDIQVVWWFTTHIGVIIADVVVGIVIVLGGFTMFDSVTLVIVFGVVMIIVVGSVTVVEVMVGVVSLII